jgi:hypothetical protein
MVSRQNSDCSRPRNSYSLFFVAPILRWNTLSTTGLPDLRRRPKILRGTVFAEHQHGRMLGNVANGCWESSLDSVLQLGSLPSLERVLLLQLFHRLAPSALESLGLCHETLRSLGPFAHNPQQPLRRD